MGNGYMNHNVENSSLQLQFTAASIFFLVLIITVWIYWIGLPGAYLLDDMANLDALERINKSSDKFTEIIRFSLEGIASQLGRPISLFTFALQAHHWSDPAWHFKYVNLMIHLLNGCLIFWLLWCITRIMAMPEKRGLWLALLTTSLWLLHPFQVSTVLYVVQRMTELAAFFTLAALLIYVRSRQQLAQGLLTPTVFWILLSLGIGLGGLLATLSKENGILLVLYVLVLEATVLRTLPKPRYWQLWAWVFLYLPLLALVAYFILTFDNILKGYETRDFTLVERLLTQARILIDYLVKILIPRLQSYGLFQDDFPLSQSLLNPPSTVIAVGFISLMGLAAFLWRKKYPIFALAVLWFLAGHLLESSFIGLMLYFEHRNYLPMLGILFAISYGSFWLFDQMRVTSLRQAAFFFSGLYFLLFVVITRLETDLWGKPLLQTVVWAEQHPRSRLAQSQAASTYVSLGNKPKALETYQHMVNVFPKDSGPYALWLGATCGKLNLPLPDMEQVIQRFQSTPGDTATFNILQSIIDLQAAGHCSQLSFETVNMLLQTMTKNSSITNYYKSELYRLYARFYSNQKRYADAIRMADNSLSLSPDRNLRFQKLIWLQAEGRYREALAEIAKIRAGLNLFSSGLYAEELNRGERFIQQKIQEIEQKTVN